MAQCGVQPHTQHERMNSLYRPEYKNATTDTLYVTQSLCMQEKRESEREKEKREDGQGQQSVPLLCVLFVRLLLCHGYGVWLDTNHNRVNEL